MKYLLTLFFVVLFSSNAVGVDEYGYLSPQEVSALPKEQADFINNFISASRSGNEMAMGDLFHSCVRKNPDIFSKLISHYAKSNIQEVYAVLIQPGKSKDSLYFNIRHERHVSDGEKNTSFMLLKDVSLEKDKLVIKFRCN